jgi:transposase-like protein
MAPPDMVVTDGGSGFERARKKVWKKTKVQRCLFHVFSQVKRYTTSRPKLPAGVELYSLAIDLLHIKTLKQASDWVGSYLSWCHRWEDFLNEKTYVDKNWV